MTKPWLVICPGDSLHQITTEHLAGYPFENRIAVNSAILHPAPVAYWCFLDITALQVVRHTHPIGTPWWKDTADQTRMLVPQDLMSLRIQKISMTSWKQIKSFKRVHFHRHGRKAYGFSLPWADDLRWFKLSTLVALAFACSRGGREITALGGGLGTRRYYDGRDIPEKDYGWRRSYEFRALRDLKIIAARHGVTINDGV